MTQKNRIAQALVGIASLAISITANAEWKLNNQESQLSFVSIKKDAVAEVNTFKQLSGNVDAKGVVIMEIELASIDSAIAIRDERMRKFLFETNLFPKAIVSGKIDLRALKALKPGQRTSQNLKLKLSLHDHSNTVSANVTVVKLRDGGLMVTTIEPIIVSAADYGMVKGIERLREIAKLPSISKAVPVTLNLVFDNER